MKFGQVEDPSLIDFTIPQDHINTSLVLERNKEGLKDIFVGCAKWNKTDLKGFYPKGTKDELTYYATQFNSIEMNATFMVCLFRIRSRFGKIKLRNPLSFSKNN